jgi:hypothetical protein
MSKKYFFACLVFILIILTGCETLQKAESTTTTSTTTTITTTTIATSGREYYPNTDGYSWTYNFSGGGFSGTVTFIINGTTTVGGLTVQKWKTESSLGGTAESLIRVTDSNVKSYGTLTSPTTEAYTSLVFPLKIGNNWITSGTYEATVLSQEDVSVPAGTFSGCFKIRDYSSYGYSDTFLAKNTGMVKAVSVMISRYGTVETTIVSTLELTAKNF